MTNDSSSTKSAYPKFYFDENLRDLPSDVEATQTYVEKLYSELRSIEDLQEQVSLLGEIGVLLRQLGKVDQAEVELKKALQLIQTHGLGLRREIQQKIRLAHVVQWQGKFEQADRLFTDVVSVCRNSPDAQMYLDFALQHAGKNYFDQKRWSEALACFEEALLIRQQRNASSDQIQSTELAITRTRQLMQPRGFTGDIVNRGQCYCGSVQYEVKEPFKFVAHDHCSICRRISGAAFVTWAGVMENQFKLTSGLGHLSKFNTTPEAERQFCSKCGSHLFFRSNRWPGEVHFTISTLMTKLATPPKAHVFYSDRAEWMHIHDDLPKYGGKTGTEPLQSEDLG